jgi:preprotein translocase SecE subunit
MSTEVKSMDIKKAQGSEAHSKGMTKQKIQEFISEVKAEMHKIHWTSRAELLVYAKIVVTTTLVFGFGIYFTDLTIQAVLNTLSYLVRFIAG